MKLIQFTSTTGKTLVWVNSDAVTLVVSIVDHPQRTSIHTTAGTSVQVDGNIQEVITKLTPQSKPKIKRKIVYGKS